ncbi:MAG TPA: SoxR reducing system RseC family protein [Methylophilus sp.]
MVEERALIVAPHENPALDLVYVEIERRTACGLCGQTRGCGNQVWGKLFRHADARFTARNGIHAEVGQQVMIAIDERAVMHAALLLYFLPLVAMLLVSLFCNWWFDSNLASMLGAVVGLVGAWWWVRGFLAVRPHGFSQPHIVRLADAF